MTYFLRGIASRVSMSALCLALASLEVAAAPASVIATPIEQFRKGSDETRFGALSYVGGFSFSSPGSGVAGLSGLVVEETGESFTAVTDMGNWVRGRILRDAAGIPTGLADVDFEALTGTDGAALDGKLDSDAEGLARRGDDLIVSFERRPRIWRYPVRGGDIGNPEPLSQPIPSFELRANKGLEALAIAPEDSPLAGALVTIAEGSIDTNGNLFAAIVDSPRPGIFKLRKDERWDVTDADFLPGGDLLVLERRYDGFTGGLGARIRRISWDRITPGSLADGDVIFEVDLSEEIDNMEGLAIWQDEADRTRITLVSDDNNSFLQRNLLLEFILENEEAGR